MPRVRRAAKDYNPPALEREVQAYWRRTRAHDKVRAARARGKPFYFIDGPPYTSGHIHLGTAWNKVLKDSVLRWRRMKGFHVRDQAGFDMHGLPIEVKVEQELGIRRKKEIEELGVDKFVARCREFSVRFLDVMTREFEELGVWLDWRKPYMTITNRYIEGAWGAFAKAWQRGLVSRAQRTIAWCWRCETALAAAELEYEEREDPSLYVKFPLAGRAGEHLVVWTTTPWTLPGNVAIAANAGLRYAKLLARRDGREEALWVVESQAERVAALGKYASHAIVESRAGRELEGWRYEHPFRDEVEFHREPGDARNRVILGEHVTAEKTGLVHTATGFGAEDFEVGQRYGIGAFCPVDEAGFYTADAGAFAGRFVRDAEPDIVARLEAKGLLLQAATERHAYPHCWRCKQPVLYRATDQWFLAVSRLRERMLREVERVRWVPEWAGSARQRDWVAQARDWCVSRQRYWGIPIPIWRCARGHAEVVGSLAELRRRAANYGTVLGQYKAQLRVSDLEKRLGSAPAGELDLHRPWIDLVELRCGACDEPMRRVPDVFDVWYDSACASWAQLGWPRSRRELERWWPCDWIVEGLDQTRGWFYGQLAAGVAAFGRAPYRAVLMHGFVHDEEGRPMSKSLGNIVAPQEVIAEHGADALRLYLLATCPPWEDVNFSREGVRNAQRTLTILWNVHVLATEALEGLQPSRIRAPARALRPEDRWLLSRVAGVAREVDAAFAAGQLHRAARAIQDFVVEDVSRWYVRLVRDRLFNPASAADRDAARATLLHALQATARLLAPVCPHVAERLHLDLGGKLATVHAEPWPTAARGQRSRVLEARMARARAIVEAALQARERAGLKLRQPVAKLTVAGDAATRAAARALAGAIAEAANAKRVEVAGERWEGLAWRAQPEPARLGPAFKARAPEVAEALRAMPAAELREALARGPVRLRLPGGEEAEVAPGMVRFEAALPEGTVGADFDGGSVYLDARLSPELQAEGLAREVARRIQEMRKEARLARRQSIRTELSLAAGGADALAPWLGRIARQTRSRSLRIVAEPRGRLVKEWDIEGERVVVAIR